MFHVHAVLCYAVLSSAGLYTEMAISALLLSEMVDESLEDRKPRAIKQIPRQHA
jgi:hypothetical protein